VTEVVTEAVWFAASVTVRVRLQVTLDEAPVVSIAMEGPGPAVSVGVGPLSVLLG